MSNVISSDKIVYILGAGCSQEDNVPLINDFFDVAFHSVLNHLPKNQQKRFNNIREFRDAVLPGSNIEELFSYVDLERYLFPGDDIAGYEPDEIRGFGS